MNDKASSFENLALIGRDQELFADDIQRFEADLTSLVQRSSFLVIGGAGSVGQAVTKEIFLRDPLRLHVVDCNENNLVELVRDIRSSIGYRQGEFQTLPLDCGSIEFDAFLRTQDRYDYILNLSALKHVRSEKDPYTLMRMIDVNILNTEKTLQYAAANGCRKYFAVSTDKAVNPVNMMGASKGIMELCLMRASARLNVSTARFANVAFSDGSLLHGFEQRLKKRQPLSAPNDVRRYFITMQESGQLCLMSCLLGDNRDVFFPKLSDKLKLTYFPGIAERFLESRGFAAFPCASEDEARGRIEELIAKKHWPCYFFASDTTGEKDFEEFFSADETVDEARFQQIGIIKKQAVFDAQGLDAFLAAVRSHRARGQWTKADLVALFGMLLADFRHKETHKYLDGRM
jgi:FlaA1/EpsC-like NDP-sugar epimerase